MRRVFLLVKVALVMAATILASALPTVFAQGKPETTPKSSEATLNGRYLFAYDGFAIEGKDRVPGAAAGYEVYDGTGNVSGVSSYSVNGKITRNEPYSGTYNVEADCTGTVKYTHGTRYDLFIAPDGSTFTWVQANPGFVTAGVEHRGTATRVGD